MSDVTSLKSYLVSLGFAPNMQQFRQFQNTLQSASSLVKGEVAKMATDVLKWETVVIGAFIGISTAIVTSIDKVAMADQEYRLLGERMFMDTAHARSMDIALKALGVTLNDVFIDQELHDRFKDLIKLQDTLQKQLGPDYEATMKQIRDVRMEFTKFEIEGQYFLMNIASQIFKQLGFGSGDFAKKLQEINDYIVSHIPDWSAKFATYVVPVLKDTWMILQDIWQVAKDVAELFDDIMSIFTGDATLQGVATFDKFARSVGALAHFLAMAVHYLTKITGLISGLAIGGTVGSILGAAIGGILGIPGGPAGVFAGVLAGGATGGAIGAGVGGASGGVWDIYRASKSPTDDPSANQGYPTGSGSGSTAAQAYALAQQLSGQLNVPADILYRQFAHETGNFTNRGATSLNNLAGIKNPGGNGYRSFDSIQDFGNYYGKLIKHRYSDAVGSKSVDQYASALKRGGYFQDSLSNYEHGMNGVTIGSINITHPGASAEEITNHIGERIKEERKKQNQRNLTELTSVYG